MAQLSIWTCEDVRGALGPLPWHRLGGGGQGSVFACELGGAAVAVKHLEGDSVASLNDELEVLARVRHENLLRVLGYVRLAPACSVAQRSRACAGQG